MDGIKCKELAVTSFLVPGIFPHHFCDMVKKCELFDIWNKKIFIVLYDLAHFSNFDLAEKTNLE